MAVYTHVDEKALRAFLAPYNLAPLKHFEGIDEGISNTNYHVFFVDGSRLVLTLYEHERRLSLADVPFFLSLMRHISDKGLPCPTPIRDRHGAMTSLLCGKHAALFCFLQGTPVRVITLEHCRQVGTQLARLHCATASLPLQRANPFDLSGWRALAEQLNPPRPMRTTINETLARFDEGDMSLLPKGIIHADLFPDNVFFDKETLCGIIDFYFACVDNLAYDLAITLNAWCFDDKHTLRPTYAQALLAAYDKERPLSPEERHRLPLLCQGAALNFLLTRLQDQQAFDHPLPDKDPQEYHNKLLFHHNHPMIATLLP
ncbi:MAG: homoserine kinase [Alphaproteobacteria bacterium GM202ARS2]|nr:homoserine kinase [Alphaproteobacteria bacterium GM202ARS2]